MSTFISNDENDSLILVKCAQRFMLFESEHGNFLDEVEFEDLREERESEFLI